MLLGACQSPFFLVLCQCLATGFLRFLTMSAPLVQRLADKTSKGSASITRRITFDSLSQCAAWAADRSVKRWTTGSSHATGADRLKFTGTASFDEAMTLVQRGWSDGRKKLVKGVESLVLKKELASAPSFVYDVAGARPEVPLAVAGDPCCMWDTNPLQEAQTPVLRFVIDVTASCQWEVDELIRWGTVILSVIDSLEADGRCTVELSTAITIQSFCEKRQLEFITQIKKPGQHIDFDVMAFAIAHPSMLRRIGFGCCERVVEDKMESFMQESYGRPGSIDPASLDGAYYVPGINYCGIKSELLRSPEYQVELFDAVMNGFKRLADGLPFSDKQ